MTRPIIAILPAPGRNHTVQYALLSGHESYFIHRKVLVNGVKGVPIHLHTQLLVKRQLLKAFVPQIPSHRVSSGFKSSADPCARVSLDCTGGGVRGSDSLVPLPLTSHTFTPNLGRGSRSASHWIGDIELTLSDYVSVPGGAS